MKVVNLATFTSSSPWYVPVLGTYHISIASCHFDNLRLKERNRNE